MTYALMEVVTDIAPYHNGYSPSQKGDSSHKKFLKFKFAAGRFRPTSPTQNKVKSILK